MAFLYSVVKIFHPPWVQMTLENENSTAALMEKVKAEIRRNPTPQLIVLLRTLEIMLEEEEHDRGDQAKKHADRAADDRITAIWR